MDKKKKKNKKKKPLNLSDFLQKNEKKAPEGTDTSFPKVDEVTTHITPEVDDDSVLNFELVICPFGFRTELEFSSKGNIEEFYTAISSIIRVNRSYFAVLMDSGDQPSLENIISQKKIIVYLHGNGDESNAFSYRRFAMQKLEFEKDKELGKTDIFELYKQRILYQLESLKVLKKHKEKYLNIAFNEILGIIKNIGSNLKNIVVTLSYLPKLLEMYKKSVESNDFTSKFIPLKNLEEMEKQRKAKSEEMVLEIKKFEETNDITKTLNNQKSELDNFFSKLLLIEKKLDSFEKRNLGVICHQFGEDIKLCHSKFRSITIELVKFRNLKYDCLVDSKISDFMCLSVLLSPANEFFNNLLVVNDEFRNSKLLGNIKNFNSLEGRVYDHLEHAFLIELLERRKSYYRDLEKFMSTEKKIRLEFIRFLGEIFHFKQDTRMKFFFEFHKDFVNNENLETKFLKRLQIFDDGHSRRNYVLKCFGNHKIIHSSNHENKVILNFLLSPLLRNYGKGEDFKKILKNVYKQVKEIKSSFKKDWKEEISGKLGNCGDIFSENCGAIIKKVHEFEEYVKALVQKYENETYRLQIMVSNLTYKQYLDVLDKKLGEYKEFKSNTKRKKNLNKSTTEETFGGTSFFSVDKYVL